MNNNNLNATAYDPWSGMPVFVEQDEHALASLGYDSFAAAEPTGPAADPWANIR